MKELIKTGLYIVATGGMIYAMGAVDSPNGDLIDIVAGGMSAMTSLLLAEKIKIEEVIKPELTILEVPQRRAYNWAKDGLKG